MTVRGRGAEPAAGAFETLLLGTVSRDRYLDSGEELPGGGVLNVAWHWRQLGRPFVLLSRVGDVDAAAAIDLLDRAAIPYVADFIVAHGRSASIDIVIEGDRQPFMDHFVEGVWASFRLTPHEDRVLDDARRLHAVLVEGAIAELDRLAGPGRPASRGVGGLPRLPTLHARSVRRNDAPRGRRVRGLARRCGRPDRRGIWAVAFDLGRLVVVTMGARSVRVFDGRGEPRDLEIPIDAVTIRGTTLGCGDAFIAYCLDELWRSGDVVAAVERGKFAGAMATGWPRALPDDVYPIR